MDYYLHDNKFYDDALSKRANPFPLTFLELRRIYLLRVRSALFWMSRVLGTGDVFSYYELQISC